MIVEIRTYTFKSGTMGKYLQAFRDVGFELQRRHLGECIGFYTSETGPIEQVVQIFGYVDWNEREKKRAALWADVRFTAMSAELHPLIQSKESQILRAVDFRSSTILNRQADGLVLAAAPSEANQGKQKQRGE